MNFWRGEWQNLEPTNHIQSSTINCHLSKSEKETPTNRQLTLGSLKDLRHNEVFIGFCRHLDVDCAAKVAERGDITEASTAGLADEKSRLLLI